MKLKRTMTAVALIGVLALTGCSASSDGKPTKPLPPTSDATSDPTPPANEGTKLPEPFVSETEVNSQGVERFPELETNFLALTGANDGELSYQGKPTPMRDILLGGGAVPTQEFSLNVAYEMCNEVVANGWEMETGGDLDAIPKAMESIIGEKMGFTAEDAQVGNGWSQFLAESWQRLCLPALDERVRAEMAG